jgi:hypothetical protein
VDPTRPDRAVPAQSSASRASDPAPKSGPKPHFRAKKDTNGLDFAPVNSFNGNNMSTFTESRSHPRRKMRVGIREIALATRLHYRTVLRHEHEHQFTYGDLPSVARYICDHMKKETQ